MWPRRAWFLQLLHKQNLTLASLGLLWLLMVGTGLKILWDYEATPGSTRTPSSQWPSGSRISRGPTATLVMFAHPHCPCTRASIGELALLMARCQGQVSAHVLFLKPQGFNGDWVHSDLWRSAAAIPGVQVAVDEDGQEAKRFSAMTSGYTLLYDRQGHVLFRGGITSSRGHSGENAGRDAIVSLLTTGRAERTQTPVFGCSILNAPAEQPAEQPTGGK